MADETPDDVDASATDSELAAQMGRVGAGGDGGSGAEGQGEAPQETEAESSPALGAEESSEPQPETGAEADQGAPPSDEQSVPRERFNTEISKRRALETRNQTLERELAELRRTQRASSVQDAVTQRIAADPAFRGKDGKVDIDQRVIKIAAAAAEELMDRRLNGSLEQVQALAAERRVQQDVGVPMNAPQIRSVAKLMTEHPTLTAKQAYALAQQTNPTAFSSGDARGASNTHFSTQPSGGTSPGRKPLGERDALLKAIAEAPEGSDTSNLMQRAMQLSGPGAASRQKR